MVILRSQNNTNDFLMILAWAFPFKHNKNTQTLPSNRNIYKYGSSGASSDENGRIVLISRVLFLSSLALVHDSIDYNLILVFLDSIFFFSPQNIRSNFGGNYSDWLVSKPP